MNQILETKSSVRKKKNLKYFLKVQLFISIFLICILGIYIGYSKFILYKKEQFSNKLLNNYNITKIYANYSNNSINESEDFENTSNIIGIIEIPSINIHYPVFSTCNDELLKTSPCKLYGPSPGKNGNLCIAGHNYDNDKFFSKLPLLKENDEIILYNYYNKKFSYLVYDIYEVKPDDLSPIYSYDKSSKQLTIITCNNSNKNRLIVKAKIET